MGYVSFLDEVAELVGKEVIVSLLGGKSVKGKLVFAGEDFIELVDELKYFDCVFSKTTYIIPKYAVQYMAIWEAGNVGQESGEQDKVR